MTCCSASQRKPSFGKSFSLFAVAAVAAGLIGFGMMSQSPVPATAATRNAEPLPGLPEAPAFTLTDAQGNEHSLSDFRGKFVVLEWFNPGCPFVVKFYQAGKMQELQQTYTDKGVVWLTVTSTNPSHTDYLDAAGLNDKVQAWDMHPTAVLRDDDGTVGKAYKASTTPHMYVINPDGKLVYQGAIDSKRSTKSEDIESATNYVEQVLDASLLQSTQPYGCSIKYAN